MGMKTLGGSTILLCLRIGWAHIEPLLSRKECSLINLPHVGKRMLYSMRGQASGLEGGEGLVKDLLELFVSLLLGPELLAAIMQKASELLHALSQLDGKVRFIILLLLGRSAAPPLRPSGLEHLPLQDLILACARRKDTLMEPRDQHRARIEQMLLQQGPLLGLRDISGKPHEKRAGRKAARDAAEARDAVHLEHVKNVTPSVLLLRQA